MGFGRTSQTLATAREDLSARTDRKRQRPPSPRTRYAFDVLAIGGADLRERPLLERKGQLAELVRGIPHNHYVEHLEAYGEALFAQVCELDVEGIRREAGRFDLPSRPTARMVKVKNPNYSRQEASRFGDE